MTIATRPICRLALVAVLLGACSAPSPIAPSVTLRTQAAPSGETVEPARKDSPKGPSHPGKTGPSPAPVAARPAPQPKPSAGQPRRSKPTPTPGGTPYPDNGRYPYPDYRHYPNPDYGQYPDGTQGEARITRVWTEAVGSDRFTVNWTTAMPTTGMVQWGTDGYRERSDWQFPADSVHSYTVTDLEPGTGYRFRVLSRYNGGGTVMSPEMRVTTES